MPRPVAQQSEPINSDSFLDIVASVVSIMIIMVVMEGSRIKNAPVKVSIPANSAVAALEKDLAAEQALRGDVLKSAEEIRNLEQETVKRGTQRDVLATMVSAVEHKIQAAAAEARHRQAGRLRSGPQPLGIAVPTGAVGRNSGSRWRTPRPRRLSWKAIPRRSAGRSTVRRPTSWWPTTAWR